MKKNILSSILSIVCVVGLQASDLDCELYNIVFNQCIKNFTSSKIYFLKKIEDNNCDGWEYFYFKELKGNDGDSINFDSDYSISSDTVLNCINQPNTEIVEWSTLNKMQRLMDEMDESKYQQIYSFRFTRILYLNHKYAFVILRYNHPRMTLSIVFKKNNVQIWEIYKTHLSV